MVASFCFLMNSATKFNNLHNAAQSCHPDVRREPPGKQLSTRPHHSKISIPD